MPCLRRIRSTSSGAAGWPGGPSGARAGTPGRGSSPRGAGWPSAARRSSERTARRTASATPDAEAPIASTSARTRWPGSEPTARRGPERGGTTAGPTATAGCPASRSGTRPCTCRPDRLPAGAGSARGHSVRPRSSRPTRPAARRWRSGGSEHLDLGLVAEHQTVRCGTGPTAANLDVLAQQRLGHAPDVLESAPLHDDRVLDLAGHHGAVLVDRGVRAHQRVLHDRAPADDRRAADHRPRHLGTVLHHHSPDDPRRPVDLTVHARLEPGQHHPVRLEQVLELAGVLPPPGDHLGPDRAAGVDHPLDRVRDLELAPPGGLDAVDRLMHRSVEQVHADQRQVGDPLLRLLDEPDHTVPLEHGHPEPLRLADLGQEDLRVRRVPLEPLDEAGDPLEEHVVAEVHHEVVVTEEVPGHDDRVRQPQRLVLGDVGDRQPPRGPIAARGLDLGGGVADHDPHLADPGLGDRLEPVEQDRRVGDGDQLFGAGVGDRAEAGPLAAGEDQGLHSAVTVPKLDQSGPTTTATSASPSTPSSTAVCGRSSAKYPARRSRRGPMPREYRIWLSSYASGGWATRRTTNPANRSVLATSAAASPSPYTRTVITPGEGSVWARVRPSFPRGRPLPSASNSRSASSCSATTYDTPSISWGTEGTTRKSRLSPPEGSSSASCRSF